MKVLGKNSGLSLAEAISSIFLLLTAILMSAALMQASFQYQTKARQRVEAAVLAQSVLAEVRAWAWNRSGGRYNYNTSWSLYQGTVRTVGNYRVRIDSRPNSVRLASPCNSLESQFGAQSRFLNSSVVPVRVAVEWGRSDSLRLLSYIGEPPRLPQSVVVRQTGGSLAPNGIANFSAQAFDSNGDEMPDMMFRWYLQPVGTTPGMGSLAPPWGGQFQPPVPLGARDGRTASVKNTFRSDDGSWITVGGDVSVQAATVGHGREIVGQQVVQLSP